MFQKIFDEVKYLCRVATAGSKEARELERVKKVFEEVYRTESAFTDEVKYSITAKMTDAERYVDLKDKSIAVITETATAEYADEVSSLEELKRKAKGKAEKIIYPLANKLGITTKKLSHEDIDVEFIFSKNGGLKESLNKQFRYGGDYADFAKALINLDRVLDSAVLIEIHGDKYQGTTRANENLESVYVLLGAFQDGKNIIPVQMEIKKSSDVGGRLYMTVALTKIEADVLGSTPEKVQTRSLIPASNYSLADVVREINPEDAHFLKYLPDDMLSAAQIAAKNKALEEDAKRIEGYRKGIAPVMSLSEQNQLSNNDMFPLSWQVKGKDVALEGLAPVGVAETTKASVSKTESVAPVAEKATAEPVSETDMFPMPGDIEGEYEATAQSAQEQSSFARSLRYKASKVNQSILQLVNRVKQGQSFGNEKVQLTVISDDVATRIQELTGFDVHGYKVAVEARQVDHILKEHGENGRTDHSMANAADIAKMEYALENPDSIVKAGTTRAYVTNKNGKMKPADTVLYEKQNGDGSYYVVQAVPDTNKKTLYIVTAFIGKKGYKKGEAPQSTNANSPGATPEAESVAASDNIISRTEPIVNDDIAPVAENATTTEMFPDDLAPVKEQPVAEAYEARVIVWVNIMLSLGAVTRKRFNSSASIRTVKNELSGTKKNVTVLYVAQKPIARRWQKHIMRS